VKRRDATSLAPAQIRQQNEPAADSSADRPRGAASEAGACAAVAEGFNEVSTLAEGALALQQDIVSHKAPKGEIITLRIGLNLGPRSPPTSFQREEGMWGNDCGLCVVFACRVPRLS